MTLKTKSDEIDWEAWEDGREAGRHCKPKENPFRKGWGETHTDEQEKAAKSWDQGYDFGDADYLRDLAYEKHRDDD